MSGLLPAEARLGEGEEEVVFEPGLSPRGCNPDENDEEAGIVWIHTPGQGPLYGPHSDM